MLLTNEVQAQVFSEAVGKFKLKCLVRLRALIEAKQSQLELLMKTSFL